MDPKYMRLLPLALLLLLAMAMALGLLNSKIPDHDDRIVGRHITPFELPSVGGGAHFSTKLWENKVVVLNVFSSWCGPCGVENPVLIKLAQAGVPIYGIAWKDKAQNAASWLVRHGNPYQAVGVDERGVTTIPLTLTGVPETFIINKDGSVYYHHKTALTDNVANTLIIPLVERLNKGDAQ